MDGYIVDFAAGDYCSSPVSNRGVNVAMAMKVTSF